MINNGWRRQNLLGQHHFNPDTNQLTTAGELRVQWIMTQAPPDRRNIFIERTLDGDVNAKRLAVVRDYATRVSIGRPHAGRLKKRIWFRKAARRQWWMRRM